MTRSPTPLEQLSLTNDRTDYMFYSLTLPPSASSDTGDSHNIPSETSSSDGDMRHNDDSAVAALNLTISTIESSAFLLFLDGDFIGTCIGVFLFSFQCSAAKPHRILSPMNDPSGSANDHTKGPDHLPLTISVPGNRAPHAIYRGLWCVAECCDTL